MQRRGRAAEPLYQTQRDHPLPTNGLRKPATGCSPADPHKEPIDHLIQRLRTCIYHRYASSGLPSAGLLGQLLHFGLGQGFLDSICAPGGIRHPGVHQNCTPVHEYEIAPAYAKGCLHYGCVKLRALGRPFFMRAPAVHHTPG